MSPYETIRCEEQPGGVLHLRLDRPSKHNALDARMIRELTEAAGLIAAAPLRAVVISGEGKSFCAGGDLGWMREQFSARPERREAEARTLSGMLRALDSLPQFVIAAVHGAALGGGTGLACVADVVIATEDARFALSETRLGLIPATIAPFVLRRIGLAGLRRIGLHGDTLRAPEAKAIGLVSELAGAEGLDAAVARHLALIHTAAPGAVAEAKALFRGLAATADPDALAVAALVRRWQSDEAQAGIAAFVAKEPPPWQT